MGQEMGSGWLSGRTRGANSPPSVLARSGGREIGVNPAEASYLKGLSLLKQDRAGDAAAAFRQTIRLAPKVAIAHHMLGVALQKLGQLDEADAAISKAIGLDRHQADFFANRALVRIGHQRFGAAMEDARSALRIAPRHIGAWCNLALAQLGDKQFTQAAATYMRVVEIAPDFEPAHDNMAVAILEIEEPADALAAARAYVAAAPRRALAWRLLGDSWRELGDSRPAWEAYQKSLELGPDDIFTNVGLLFHMNYLDNVGDNTRLAAIGNLTRILRSSARPLRHRADATAAERPMRLGIVSGDFREHSVSQFLLDLLPHMGDQGLSLVAYQTKKRTDAVTERLRPNFGAWRDITDVSDEAAAQLIRKDRIDILVDLSGLTAGERQKLFAMRPAPLAITWLGYSATTANPEIDYVVCNADVMPQQEEAFFTERPLRLAGPHICFSRPAANLPAAVDDGQFRFGSFNRLNKLSDRTVRVWSRILAAAPQTTLVLKTAALAVPAARDETLARFAAQGIAPDRLELIGRTPTREGHLELYGRISLALDPWPYSGTTTTMEALAMGVPVLALNDGPFISRVSASLLNQAGLQNWVAASEDDYVDKAVAAAMAGAPDGDERLTLREQVMNSPICDPIAFSAEFAGAMRRIWRDWCATGTA